MVQSIVFEIIGSQRLSCAGCEGRVANLLRALEGVDQVRAKAHTQHIEISFDTASLSVAAIAERLNQAGYETRLIRGE